MVEVAFCPKGGQALETLSVTRVVNCSGPGADYDRITHPLVRSLLADGTRGRTRCAWVWT